jgi:hypothetical protein
MQCWLFDESLRLESLLRLRAFVYATLESFVDTGTCVGALTIVSSPQLQWHPGTLGEVG